MQWCRTSSGALVVAVLLLSAGRAAGAPYPWPTGEADGTLETRIAPPAGYTRVVAPTGSFAAWLRALPLRPGRPPVHLHDGRLKQNQSAHHAVVAMDVGGQDLQQCADAAIRLRAEYLWASGRDGDICFRFTSGDEASWSAWRAGDRPRVGRRVRWVRTGAEDGTYQGFRHYLETVFRYAGTASLARDLPRAALAQLQPGDLFLQGGFPGHAVVVLDVARDAAGRTVMLLGQSYMPAQELHVLRNPADPSSPWYAAEGRGELVTPEWTFSWDALYRFPASACRREQRR